MFKRMKMGAKILTALGAMIVIASAIGITGIMNIRSIDKADTYLYKEITKPMTHLSNASIKFQRVRLNLRDLIMTSDNNEKAQIKQKIDEFIDSISENLKKYSTTISKDKDRTLFNELAEARKTYHGYISQIVALALADKDAEAAALTNGPAKQAAFDEQKCFDNLVEYKDNEGEMVSRQNSALADTSATLTVSFLVAGVITALLLGLFLRKNVVGIIRSLMDETKQLEEAALKGQLDKRGDPEQINFEFRDIITGINKTLDAVIKPLTFSAGYVDRIAKGDIPPLITDEYKGDFNEIKNNLNQCIGTLNTLINDMNHMSDEHNKGDIDVVIDPSKFSGAYKTMASGINEMVGGHISVKKKAMACLAEFGRGNFEATLERFPGKKAFINETIEQVRTNLKALIADADMLAAAAVEGRLETRADATKHQGDFRKIIKGVNDTLDAVIGPLNVAADIIHKISNNQIPPPITEAYNGDFNVIKTNLNLHVSNLSVLISSLKAAIEGQKSGDIEARCRFDNIGGVYAEILNGVNQSLDSFILPVTDALGILNEYAEGNLSREVPPLPGKQKIITENVNKVRNNIRALVADAGLLSAGAVEGRLDIRADATKHQGDYRKIIEGINSALNELTLPVNEAVGVIKEMAKGNLKVSVEGQYRGDHVVLKNAINETIDSISETLSQVIVTVEEVTRGSVQVANASTALSQGATEQAASLEEITSSMSEIGSQTRLNAENANQANLLTTEARNAADKGNEEMTQLNTAMSEITESSRNISKIIKVIDEIAFQTNLLALNAAVEAARAGRHGKGFAVVAEEVRNLAARSASAAKETAEMIEGSIKTVEKGSDLAAKTAKALEDIKNGSVKSADIVGEIALSSNEQAKGISQINEGLVQIDKVTQTNTASAEQSASAAEELSSQAALLKQMISRFSLKDNGSIGNYMNNDNGGFGHGANYSNGRNGMKKSVQNAWSSDRTAQKYTPEEVISLDESEFGRY